MGLTIFELWVMETENWVMETGYPNSLLTTSSFLVELKAPLWCYFIWKYITKYRYMSSQRNSELIVKDF